MTGKRSDASTLRVYHCQSDAFPPMDRARISAMKEDSEDRLHACPSCGSQAVRRSLRHGFVENVVYRILAIRPYRCMACDLRFTDRGVGRGRKVSSRE